MLPGEVINVGTGCRVSLNQTLQLLRRITGKNLEARYEPTREGDIRDSQADITKARELLGYEPTVMFEEGLERTFAWYQLAPRKKRRRISQPSALILHLQSGGNLCPLQILLCAC